MRRLLSHLGRPSSAQKPQEVVMTSHLPFSGAAERNQEPISEILAELLAVDTPRILEIGSGTGQHVEFFAGRFPHWQLQPSDRDNTNFDAIEARASTYPNVASPVLIDLLSPPTDIPRVYDAVLAVNVFQVAPSAIVDALFHLARTVLRPSGQVFTYSPLTHKGHFTSEGDRQFHMRLRERSPDLGIRSFEEVQRAALDAGFSSCTEHAMPANNWLTHAR